MMYTYIIKSYNKNLKLKFHLRINKVTKILKRYATLIIMSSTKMKPKAKTVKHKLRYEL
ncbi:hypothetical protein Hanom_Chr15g01372111 [Helianthus anomalus]